MKITYLAAVLLYLIFFIRIYKSKFPMVELLIFSVIAAPGILINGDLINLIDIVVPVMFLYYFVYKNRKMYLTGSERLYFAYACVCLISILFNFIDMDIILRNILQVSRMFIAVVAVCAGKSVCCGIESEKLNHIINVNGVAMCIFSIIAFLEQGTIYDAPQLLWAGGMVLHRAGGVYGEASSFGFATVFLTVSSLGLLNDSLKAHRYTAKLLFVLSIVCNIMSFTRVTNLAIIIILVIMFFRRITFKKLAALFAVVSVVAVLVAVNPVMRSFVFERMFSLLEFDRSFNDISSGRLDVWHNALDTYFGSGRLILGVGYNNGFISDNTYLMALSQMGLCGFLVVIGFLLSLYVSAVRARDIRVFYLVLALTLVSAACDALTYYRALILMFILLRIISNEKAYVKLSHTADMGEGSRHGDVLKELK